MSKEAVRGGRPKTRYRTRNWREYNQGLIARGDLTVWLSPNLAWQALEGSGKRSRPLVFSDAAIQCVLTLKVLFQLPLRAAQGMAGSLIRLAGLDWPVPHYSTLSRRQKNLTVEIPYRSRGEPLHLVQRHRQKMQARGQNALKQGLQPAGSCIFWMRLSTSHRQHRPKGAGRRGMEGQEARRRSATRLAQGASGGRR